MLDKYGADQLDDRVRNEVLYGVKEERNILHNEIVSKIFRTGADIYTAVVVARIIGPNRPKFEFRVLLRSFAATA
jgi:hypothetical protein